MKEKNIKFILELIFIFIIPLCLLATCFKQEKVYDENNNEVGKYLTFDNIFILSEEQITYYNYEYYSVDYVFEFNTDDEIKINYNKSPNIVINDVDYIYFMYNNNYYYLNLFNNTVYVNRDELVYNDYGVTIIRLATPATVSNSYGNIIKDIHIYTIGNNVINRLLSYLYDSLGITNNWILQFITIYTLLWLIMWFIWHILYLPLDFICSKLLFDRVDK